MFYEKELDFLRKTIKNCHLNSLVIDPKTPIYGGLHSGLKRIVGEKHTNRNFYDFFPNIKPYTIYRILDPFFCRYILMQLPETEEESILIIGPYLFEEMTKEQIFEIGEKAGFTPKNIRQLELFFGSLPCISESSPVFTIINTFAETIWHSEKNFSEEDIERGFASSFTLIRPQEDPAHPEDNTLNMQMMEDRYNYENQLMNAVACGQTHKAELLLSGFSAQAFEVRSPDMLRNSKNYCIIMNTLLRKAAENGGVHPIYLDSISSDFAKRIEQITQLSHIEGFMKEILKTYCQLVKSHSTSHYSTPIQKAIIKIDSDLTADLSLKALAKHTNISAGYFSGLFKSETGKTLTDFVNSRRMDAAKRLLKNTNLQIQTIAQHCGILDLNYFSKLFKKHTGKTPREYREEKWTVS